MLCFFVRNKPHFLLLKKTWDCDVVALLPKSYMYSTLPSEILSNIDTNYRILNLYVVLKIVSFLMTPSSFGHVYSRLFALEMSQKVLRVPGDEKVNSIFLWRIDCVKNNWSWTKKYIEVRRKYGSRKLLISIRVEWNVVRIDYEFVSYYYHWKYWNLCI